MSPPPTTGSWSCFRCFSEPPKGHGWLHVGRRAADAGNRSGSLMASPKLMVLDEPSLGLAPMLVQQIRDIIVDINNQGTSVLLIEQNATMALSIADYGYIMETGKIVMDGEPEKLLKDEDVQEFYLGLHTGDEGEQAFFPRREALQTQETVAVVMEQAASSRQLVACSLQLLPGPCGQSRAAKGTAAALADRRLFGRGPVVWRDRLSTVPRAERIVASVGACGQSRPAKGKVAVVMEQAASSLQPAADPVQVPLLEVDDVHLSFKGVKALEGISFSVKEGELFAIIGPNGAGKTSMFNSLNQVYRPQQGDIRWRGQSVMGMRPDKVAELGLARTFQNIELFAHMTVLDNIMLGRHVRMTSGWLAGAWYLGRAKREELEHRARVEGIIDLLEIEEWRKYPVALYSRMAFRSESNSAGL